MTPSPRPVASAARAAMRASIVVAALALPISWSLPCLAQDYPTRPIKIIVPFGAGGPADVYSRVLAQHLSEALKEPFVVEDRPGAGSIIGTDADVKAVQVRALGTSAAKRSSVLPDVPTIAEAGVPGYESTIWLGIMAPAGTPKAIVDKLNAEINKAITRSDVKEAWNKQGAVPLVMSPAEFEKYLRADIEKWADVVP